MYFWGLPSWMPFHPWNRAFCQAFAVKQKDLAPPPRSLDRMAHQSQVVQHLPLYQVWVKNQDPIILEINLGHVSRNHFGYEHPKTHLGHFWDSQSTNPGLPSVSSMAGKEKKTQFDEFPSYRPKIHHTYTESLSSLYIYMIMIDYVLI